MRKKQEERKRENFLEYFAYAFCHSREGGNPEKLIKSWIPAFAGMTFSSTSAAIAFPFFDQWLREAYCQRAGRRFLLIASARSCAQLDYIQCAFAVGSWKS